MGGPVQPDAWMVLPGVDVGEGHPEALAVEKVGDLGAGQRLQGLQVLLLAVLLLVVEVGFEFDQGFVLERTETT